MRLVKIGKIVDFTAKSSLVQMYMTYIVYDTHFC